MFESARAGDPRAFHQLLHVQGPDLLRFTAYLLHGDRHAAHDVLQEVYVRAWKELPRMEGADHFQRWTYRVARCRAVSWLRHRSPGRRRFVGLPEADDGEGGNMAELADRRLPAAVQERPPLIEALRRAVSRLPMPYGEALQLHYLQGYNTRETAALLGLPRTTVKMRLHRARQHLKRLLLCEAPPRLLKRLAAEGGAHAPSS